MTDSPIQVIDDFLPIDIFKTIAEPMMRCPCYQCMPATAKITEDDGSIGQYGEDEEMAKGQKVHEHMMQLVLVSKFQTMQQVNDLWLMLAKDFNALEAALRIKTLWMARVNVTTGQSENFVGSFHTDNHTHARKHLLELNLNNRNGNHLVNG